MPSKDLPINFYRLYSMGWSKSILEVAGIYVCRHNLFFYFLIFSLFFFPIAVNVFQRPSILMQRKTVYSILVLRLLTGRVSVGSNIPSLGLLQGAETASSESW